VTAKAGIPVRSARPRHGIRRARARRTSRKWLITEAIKKGRAKPGGQGQARLSLTSRRRADYADLEGCDLVIEAVFEDSEVKKVATEKAEAVLKSKTAIFASNTSTMPITGLAKNSVAARRISSASTSSRRSTR
jgi:3-hydroxyacyl-CoA dehydrogenase/enoyl-CoA hydratase/3-hydroxybutyryl-CoA epimerase